MNYYELLDIPEDADKADIQRAFRRKAKQWHPDLNSGDEEAVEMFKIVYEAYDTLRDPDLRAGYDRLLHAPEQPRRPVYDEPQPQSQAARDRRQAYARRRAEAYADMQYKTFRNKTIPYRQFVGVLIGVSAALTGLFALGGFMAAIGLNYIFVKSYNGSILTGYIFSGFGIGFLYRAVLGLKEAYKMWRDRHEDDTPEPE